MDYIERLAAEMILVLVMGLATLGGLFWFWPGPMKAIYMAIGLAVIYFGYDFYAKQDEPDTKAPSAAYDLIPISVLGIFLLVLVGWSTPKVRTNIITYIGPYSPTVTGRALGDNAKSVRASACESITVYHNDTLDFEQLPYTLKNRPHTAIQCLNKLEQKSKRGEAGHLMAGHKLLADRFGETWWHQLVNGKTSSQSDACLKTRAMRYSFQYTDGNWKERLFTCSLAGPNANVRRCCQQEAKSQDAKLFTEIAGDPYSLDEQLAKENYDTFFTTAFDVSKKKTGAKLPTQLEREPFQDWVVALGCRFFSSNVFRDQMMVAFDPVIKACPKKVNREQYYSATNWARLCGGLYAYNRGKQPATDAICKSLEDSAVQISVQQARSRIADARAEGSLEANGPEHNLSSEKIATPKTGASTFKSTPGVGSQVGDLFKGLIP